MDIETAVKKCRNAGVAACVQGIISLALVIYAINAGPGSDNPTIDYYNDPYLFVDIVIIFMLAAGLFLRSRTAAVMTLIYFILSKVMFIADTGKFSGIAISLIFIYLYYQGSLAHLRTRGCAGKLNLLIERNRFG
jgi:hypothetical protein